TLAETAIEPAVPAADLAPDLTASPQPLRKGQWVYQMWLLSMLLLMGLAAGGALWSLVRLPQARECPRILRPFSSAAFKLYCAQMAAGQGTTDGLLQAIELVQSLPPDHPLQQNADHYLKQWAFDLVILAEEQYNNGELALALDTLKAIPLDRLPCDENKCPRKEIEGWATAWQALWEKAEGIVQESEKALLEQNWDKAAAAATKLLSLDNRYWQVTRYNELNAQILEVRNSNSVIAKAKKLADQGGTENLIEAIKLVAQVEQNSRLYNIAQAQIVSYSGKLMELAEEALEARDLQTALNIANQIPDVANRKAELEDFKILAKVQARTWSGQVADYQAAIAELKKIDSDGSSYVKAQGLISRWETEVEDLRRIDRARTLAQRGSITGYMTAIAEASLIPQHHPRYDQAQNLIQNWNGEIQILEDSPYLERARRLAESGGVPALEAAITEANRIAADRRLYDDAQAAIRDWRGDIELIEDRPYLDEAQRLADAGRLSAAIATAQRISPNRALYNEAQDRVDEWQLQIDAEYSLQQANGLGNSNQSPEGLEAAIRAADQVPNEAPQRREADTQIDRWSEQLLQMAIERSSYDVVGAIDIANTIPESSFLFNEAQSYVNFWQESLGE
ncbi:MAG: chromosome segregation ATPase, partial [Prochlorothrix sp.]